MPRPANPRPYRKTVTRYETPEGRRCKSTDPGAVKRTEKTLTWYADIPGLGTISLETEDEALAWQALRAKLREAKDLALGIVDEYTDHARTEIDAHLARWGEFLKAKGTSTEQIDLAVNRLTRLAQLADWKRLPQITRDSAMIALAKVQAPESEGGLGKSAYTRNHYLGHLKAFVAWAHDGGRLKTNLVRSLKPVNIETDRRHPRRAPAAEEVAELCRWLGTEAAPVRRKLSGPERRLGYLLSMTTGFRAGELRALKPESFDLGEGTVTVPAAYSKRRRTDTQRLPPWLSQEVLAWFEGKGGWHWHGLTKAAPGKMLKADLRDCRAAWILAGKNASERAKREASDFLRHRVEAPHGALFWDYHSFRHAYVTKMANLPGMDLKTLLSLTRLSSAELALQTYAHEDEQRIKAAIEKIEPPQPPAP